MKRELFSGWLSWSARTHSSTGILIEISQLIASVLGDSSIKTEENLKLRYKERAAPTYYTAGKRF